MWHIDTTVIRRLDGTRAYLHAVIDNFSRRILAWRGADMIETGVLCRLLAFTELKFSNSTIEAWWRSVKHTAMATT